MVRNLLYLNGLAILGVVLYHATGWGFIAMFWWTDRYSLVSVPNFTQMESVSYYVLRFIEQFVIFSIPAFIFVSGYFVATAAGRTQKTVSWQLILNRIKKLVIPFLLWSIIILIGGMLQGQRPSPSDLLVTIVTGRTAPPFYFVPLLIQLYMLSPFLVPLARKRTGLLLSLTLVIQILILILRYTLSFDVDVTTSSTLYWLTRNWLFTSYLFWFSFGLVAAFHITKLKDIAYKLRWILLAFVILFFILGVYEWEFLLRVSGQEWIAPRETLIDQLYGGSFILSFIAFKNFTPPMSSQLAKLGTRSFGIYLAHYPAQELTARLIYHFIPVLLAYQSLYQPLLVAAGLGIPLIMMAVLNQLPLRRYYEYVFG